MKRRLAFFRTIIFVCITAFIFLFSYNTYNKVYGDIETREMTPIFDGNDGLKPTLKLIGCHGLYDNFKPNSYSKFGFRSRKVLYVTETWGAKTTKNSPPSSIARVLTIQLYYFEYPEDAAIYPYLPDERVNVLGAMKVPPWPKTANLGDKTMWLSTDTVLFAKGKVLVRIDINSKTLTQDINYLEKIARIVATKL